MTLSILGLKASRIASITFDVGNLVALKGLEDVDAPHGTSLSNGLLIGLVHWVNQRTPKTTTPRTGGTKVKSLQIPVRYKRTKIFCIRPDLRRRLAGG